MSPKRKPNRPVDVYVRVSQVNGRAGDSFISPELQEERCRAQLLADGLEAGEVFTDLDVSGGKASRPAFDAAKARIESGESGGLVVYKLSRFGRKVRNVLKDIQWIEDQDAVFVCVDPKIDTASASGRFMLTVFAALDELELDNATSAWADARQLAIARGAFTAETPWGYVRTDDRLLIPDAALAHYVRELFQRRAKGATISELSRWLKDKLIHSPSGGDSWSHSTLAQVLRNRIYVGEQRHGKFTNLNAHPPIVSEAEFEAAQVAKPLRTPEAKQHSATVLTAGLARCAGCGHTLKTVIGYGGKLRLYCKNTATESCPSRSLIRVDQLDPYVEDWFLRQVKDNVRVAGAVAAQDKAAVTQRAVDEADRELAAFVTMTSAMEPRHFQAGLEERQLKLELAKHAHAEASRESRVYDDVPSGDLLASWPTLSIQHQRRLLASFVDEVRVSQGNGSVARRVKFIRDGKAV
jgi:DNA invertase Pin-like site-specific DNA recombinase